MRENIRRFVQVVAETLPIQNPIYEFGSFRVPGQEQLADLRPLFPGREYVGCDMREGAGVDCILDMSAMDLPDESVGTILSLDTLEHVEYLREAMRECHRVLKPGGVLVLSSVMNFPIHDYPQDYWRFTPEAFRSLLQGFAFSYVDFAGDATFPHTVVGVASKGPCCAAYLCSLSAKARDWKGT